MAANWIETLQSALTGPAADKLSQWVGLDPENTGQVIQAAVPLSVASLANNVHTPESARSLLDLFRGGGVESIGIEDLDRVVGEAGSLDRIARKGEGLLGKIFRGDLGSIAATLAGHLGISQGAISKLMAVIAPIVMGYLGKTVLTKGLDAAGFLGFLRDQGRAAASLLPGPLTRLVEPHRAATAREVSPRPIEEPEPREERRAGLGWMPWALAGVAAVALFAWLLNRRKPDLTAAVGSRAVPGEVQKVSGKQPSPLKFAEYLGGRSSAPWIVEGLEYETGSEYWIVPASRGILDEVAVGLGADAAAKIRIVGHTDATGSPDANRELSRRRADSAKAYLIEKGVVAERIDTAGMGADQPIASNDSEEGRSRNRRTEIFVVR